MRDNPIMMIVVTIIVFIALSYVGKALHVVECWIEPVQLSCM